MQFLPVRVGAETDAFKLKQIYIAFIRKYDIFAVTPINMWGDFGRSDQRIALGSAILTVAKVLLR